MTVNFASDERRLAQSVADLAHCNPFLPERIEFERQALGEEFDAHFSDWNIRAGAEADHPNITRLVARAKRALDAAGDRWAKSARRNPTPVSEADKALYFDLVLFVLYHDHRDGLDRVVANASAATPGAVFRRLMADAQRYLGRWPSLAPLLEQMPHIFAGFFQIRRAFGNIFLFIVGGSRVAAELRAAVWQSIFTHDMRRYRRLLFDRMGDYATLITGPSGTGKELVAQAIGRSRYVPFDARRGRFAEDVGGSFFPINLSALSPTLIESELFGHERGAFTGAIAERVGWLEACPPTGAVFLDEIGDLDPAIQVKLLRVLQSREFSRLGETKRRQFQGKIIAATNRNLAAEMSAGRFREDLYYRLCSDIVEVPSLRERLDDEPQELQTLVAHIAQRLVGPEADSVAREVEVVILNELGPQYAWPGNVRELEQCVRNVLIRRSYHRPRQTDVATPTDPYDQLAQALRNSRLTADELVRRYCQLVYTQTGSYEATARKLALDRRTVKAKVCRSEN